MICLPNAKINLGLYVTGVRADGMHTLETVMLPIPLQDVLETKPLHFYDTQYELVTAGLPINGQPEDNLVAKVYRDLQAEFHLPPRTLHLYKRIPMGAGMGGGSSDAAFMMRLANEEFRLGLSAEEMRKRLVKIGADCPFFVDDVPAFATGVGEELSPLPEVIPQLEGKWLLLVKPEDHVSTKEAYAHVPVAKAPVDLQEAIRRPIEEWRGLISNDFEKSVLPGHPKIAAIRQTLYDLHAIYASMTGSGSAVYGFFDNSVPDPDVVFDGCFTFQSRYHLFRPTFS